MKTALQFAGFFRRHPMVNIILLDAGPLGLVTHPKGGEDARIFKAWLERQLREGTRVRIPAIADYEVRRKLIRAGKFQALERLDALVQKLGYIPLVEQAMRLAAEFWADARRSGRPTAPHRTIPLTPIASWP